MNNDDNRIQCPTCKTTYDKTFLIGKQGHADSCPMCGASLEEDLHPDWITWRYFKVKDSDTYVLCYTPPTPEYLETHELIQEFKGPPQRSPKDKLIEVKRILRTYVPDAFDYDFEPPEAKKARCPRCSSTDIQVVSKSYGLMGLGASYTARVCANCGYEL